MEYLEDAAYAAQETTREGQNGPAQHVEWLYVFRTLNHVFNIFINQINFCWYI